MLHCVQWGCIARRLDEELGEKAEEHGGNMRHCTSYLAAEEHVRPSPKCELYRFSKLCVARNDWEASDSFWVNVKVPEGLI